MSPPPRPASYREISSSSVLPRDPPLRGLEPPPFPFRGIRGGKVGKEREESFQGFFVSLLGSRFSGN